MNRSFIISVRGEFDTQEVEQIVKNAVDGIIEDLPETTAPYSVRLVTPSGVTVREFEGAAQ
jgi:hypothetical protein